MEKKTEITAVCGWALPEDWFGQLVQGYFPGARVKAFYPKNPESDEEATEILSNRADGIIGYSLGSLWILHHKNKIPPGTKVAVLAPILAFSEEKNLGGKTPMTKLKYQKKILKQSEDYAAAMKGFFDLSGIRLPEYQLQQPYSRDILIRGLDFLEKVCVAPQAAEGCTALSGLCDPLLDGRHLKKHIPHITLVEDCDHSPHKLLFQLAQHTDWRPEPSPPQTQSISSKRAL